MIAKKAVDSKKFESAAFSLGTCRRKKIDILLRKAHNEEVARATSLKGG